MWSGYEPTRTSQRRLQDLRCFSRLRSESLLGSVLLYTGSLPFTTSELFWSFGVSSISSSGSSLLSRLPKNSLLTVSVLFSLQLPFFLLLSSSSFPSHSFIYFSFAAFLINHSLEFTIAIAASFVEYFIELLLFPSMKGTLFLYLGIVITGSGQLLRTISQFHAGASFTHQVQETKRDEHVLVQSGPYRYIRHPGYLGWYWWAVGTQILLFNPICILGYAFYAWKFFKERIEYEEEHLATMFGKDYTDYRTRTPTYLPFIS